MVYAKPWPRFLSKPSHGSVGLPPKQMHQTQSISRGNSFQPTHHITTILAMRTFRLFLYVWLRHALRLLRILSRFASTITVPKAEGLNFSTAFRHGNKENAAEFFLNGMTSAMRSLVNQAHPEAPVTIYYAFKQVWIPTISLAQSRRDGSLFSML